MAQHFDEEPDKTHRNTLRILKAGLRTHRLDFILNQNLPGLSSVVIIDSIPVYRCGGSVGIV